MCGLCRIWGMAGERAMSRHRSSKAGLVAMEGGLMGDDTGDGLVCLMSFSGTAKRTFLPLAVEVAPLLLEARDSGVEANMESRLDFFGVEMFALFPLLLVLALVWMYEEGVYNKGACTSC